MSDLDIVFREKGYETYEEQQALLQWINDYPPPFNATLEQTVDWIEFLRALKEGDFTPGDTFSLNDTVFLVLLWPVEQD